MCSKHTLRTLLIKQFKVQFFFKVTRNESTAKSIHENPLPWPVWPSALRVKRVESGSILDSATPHSYGVAGSRDTLMIRIGLVLIEDKFTLLLVFEPSK